MDNVSFEQISMLNSLIGNKVKLLTENLEVTISLLEEKPLSIDLPKNINCKIETTDAVVKRSNRSIILQTSKARQWTDNIGATIY